MPVDLQPTLHGGLVALRPLSTADFDALYAVARDPLIWEQHPASDRWKRDVFTAFFEEALATGGALLASDPATGEVIGSSRYHGWDDGRREVEIGWTFLARSRWGGAVNGEMKRLMLEHAFGFADAVVFKVGPRNLRSQRALAKIGARPAGTTTDARGAESLVFRITAEEFRSRAARAL